MHDPGDHLDDPLDQLEELAARARDESPPRTDVAGAVLRELRRPGSADDRPLAWLAVASVAAAVVAGVFFVALYAAIADPLWTYFETAALLVP